MSGSIAARSRAGNLSWSIHCAGVLAAFLAAAVAIAVPAHAGTVQVRYMQVNPPVTNVYSTADICTVAGHNTNECFLAGYNGYVRVTFGSGVPAYHPFDLGQNNHNQSSTPSTNTGDAYHWGSDPQFIHLMADQSAKFDVKFEFLNGAPDINKLLLVVMGLGKATTAVLSQSGKFVGQYGMKNASGTVISKPAQFINNTTTTLKNSDSTSGNSDWALLQLTSAITLNGSTPTLTVTFDKDVLDAVGLTLGYVQQPAILKVCKVEGEGVDLGTQFHFSDSLGLNQFTVPAGPAPGGFCVVGKNGYTVGDQVVVIENEPGYAVTNISASPAGALQATDLGKGQATVKLGVGVTEVTFTNRRVPKGFVEICKRGDVTGNFTFKIDGVAGSWTIPANACSPAIEVPSGEIVITETQMAAGTTWSNNGCATIPADRQVSCNNVAHSSNVTIVPGDISTQTIAYITNRPTNVTPK